jgi:glycosyltransferase involved in cell wall biosynthesis
MEYLDDIGLLGRVAVVIAGDGEELASLKAEAEALGVSKRCIFLGGVPNREIQSLYAISDIFIHPTFNEGFPRVVIEAMASALPIVSTDAGGTCELVGPNQSDLIVDKNSPLDFSKCLARLIEDPELQRKLAKENINHVQRFSTENIAAMYEEVIFG